MCFCQTYKNNFNQLVAHYRRKPHPHTFLREHTLQVKKLLAQLWQPYALIYPHFTVLATGGFGRAELYPYSDIDLAIISPDELTPAEEEAIARFLQTLWDIPLHPAARTGSKQQLLDAAKEDITADTAFLESSYIAGDYYLAAHFIEKLFNQRDVLTFCEAKILEQKQRHTKGRSTTSSLEPNIKTCPGGLRDIHTLMWLAKAQGLPVHTEGQMEEKILSILSKDEARLLLHSHKQLARLRIDLHLIAKREEDFFAFDRQTKIARIWGFKDNAKKNQSEQIMQVLFRAQKTIKQLNLILVPILRGHICSAYPQPITELDEQFYQLGSQLTVKDFDLFETQPVYIFKALSIIQTNKEITHFSPKCLRAIWNARKKINKRFQENPINRERFMQFFIYGEGLTRTLRFMNLYDMLSRYLPAWRQIVGLMQYDLFHIYPVDDHILMVVRNLRRMTMDIHTDELPAQSELILAFDQKHILYLAALFHDIAKGSGGQHASLGMIQAKHFAQLHFLSDDETELLCWLVGAHLLMSQTAQKEDIQDPEVIERFCAQVKTPHRLTALYLLTCADMRGTNPNIWNSWKASLLSNLHHFALSYLHQSDTTDIQTHKDNIAQHLSEQAYSLVAQKRLWQALGESYFVRHQTSDILWHAVNIIEHEDRPAVCARILEGSQTLQFMVYTHDKPKVFARICQFFTRNRLNIVDAKIFTTNNQFALDTFILQNTRFTPKDLSVMCQNLPKELSDFLEKGNTELYCTMKHKASRRLRNFPISPQISLFAQEQPSFYALEIIAGDWPGILEQIAQVLAQFKIRLYYAKISTLGERVEDSFLISSPELDDARFQLRFKEKLHDILQG